MLNGGLGLAILVVVSTNILSAIFEPSLESVESLESPCIEPWGLEPLVALCLGTATLVLKVSGARCVSIESETDVS